MSGASGRIGVVLAGGQGKRLGRTKGDLHVGEQPLAQRAAGVLAPFCSEVVVSVAAEHSLRVNAYRSIPDMGAPGRGPLAGLASVFAATDAGDLLVLACDYPRVTTGLFQRLLAFADPGDDLVLFSDQRGRDHPLVALWRRRTEPTVMTALAAGRLKVRSLLLELAARRVGPDELPGVDLEHLLLNVNWPTDLKRLSSPGG